MRVSLPSRGRGFDLPLQMGREDKAVHSTVNMQGPRSLWLSHLFPPENKGKLKWGVHSASHPLLPSEDPSQIPKIPILTAEMQTIHRKHERSPSCYPRLKLQELKIVPTHTHTKKSSFPAAVHPLFINYL